MKYLIICMLTCCNFINAQQVRFENKAYGFSMLEPEGWIVADNQDLLDNLQKLDLDDARLMKIIADHKGSVLLTSFYKYDPQTYPGLIPAIQVNVREKRSKDWEAFKTSIINSAQSFKNLHDDYEFIEEPIQIKIDGIKSLYFSSKFTMKTDKGQEYRVRNRIYVIPCKDYYFQINFTDGVLGENCTIEFENLVKSIDIKR